MHNEVPQVVLQVLATLGAVTVVMSIVKLAVALEWRFTHPRCINCQREYDNSKRLS
jgi:hypothetical protein